MEAERFTGVVAVVRGSTGNCGIGGEKRATPCVWIFLLAQLSLFVSFGFVFPCSCFGEEAMFSALPL